MHLKLFLIDIFSVVSRWLMQLEVCNSCKKLC